MDGKQCGTDNTCTHDTTPQNTNMSKEIGRRGGEEQGFEQSMYTSQPQATKKQKRKHRHDEKRKKERQREDHRHMQQITKATTQGWKAITSHHDSTHMKECMTHKQQRKRRREEEERKKKRRMNPHKHRETHTKTGERSRIERHVEHSKEISAGVTREVGQHEEKRRRRKRKKRAEKESL